MARPFRDLLLAGTCLLWLGPPPPALADALRARLIAPSAQDELLVEALARVKGELSAAGFRVTAERAQSAAQAPALISRVVAQDAGTAVVVVQLQPRDRAEVATLEFWVYEPWGGETAVVRSDVDAGEPSLSAQRGAVQAVEVLRAVLAQKGLDSAVSSEPQPRQEVDTSPGPSLRDPAAASGTVHVGVGLAVLSGFDGLGSSLTPTARVSVALSGVLPSRELMLDVRASAAGLGGVSQLALAEGTVNVRQALLIGELVLRLWPRASWQPMLSLGGGAYALSVGAEAAEPFIARSPHTWSGLLGAGAGLRLQASTHFAACFEVQLAFATAPSDVLVAGRVAAVAGAPMLLTGVQLMGGF